jgi:hypothetical protein
VDRLCQKPTKRINDIECMMAQRWAADRLELAELDLTAKQGLGLPKVRRSTFSET